MVILKYFFDLACFATAFGMTVLWLYRYSLDEDSVQIDLKPFDFQPEQYPMLSFCVVNPFNEAKLKTYNESLTGDKYLEILLGSTSYNGVKKIDFDDVTIDFADFYLGDRVRLNNRTQKQSSNKKFILGSPEVTFSGFRLDAFIKCLGLKPTFKNVEYVAFELNSTIYPNGVRPSSMALSMTWVILHLPNQLSLAWSSDKYTWQKRIEKKEYLMVFKLQQIEILKRRDKRRDPCVPDDINFDQMLIDYHLKRVGCKAPYHKTNKDMEICDTKEKISQANFDLTGRERPIKPCSSAPTIIFSYDEYEYNFKGPEWFHVILQYPNQYKETKMVQAIDLQTVIGNAGGYIGLFLGRINSVLFNSLGII